MYVVTYEGAATAATRDKATAAAIAATIGAEVSEVDELHYTEAADVIARQALRLELHCDWTFIPFSQSRNRAEKSPSLNWRGIMSRAGKPLPGLESVDYMKGAGHCPAYKDTLMGKLEKARAIASECETGRRFGRGLGPSYRKIEPPSTAEIFGALARDSDVLDYSTFEAWAEECGYSSDSRQAESGYRQALAHALALRAAIGDAELQAARDTAACL